ncbi:MAG: hypothetical protein RL654_124 [Pseudomonadota bacterium]|jgi:hypothetical protein
MKIPAEMMKRGATPPRPVDPPAARVSDIAGLTVGDAAMIKRTICAAACAGRYVDLEALARDLIAAFKQVNAAGAVL